MGRELWLNVCANWHVEAPNALEALRQYTTVVADSGEFESFPQFHPTDATTNPTLILQAASSQNPLYRPIVERVVASAKSGHKSLSAVLAEVGVAWGLEILRRVPGRVSTEVDARLSRDTQATLEKAREAVGLYEAAGVPRSRVLVKIAATWEGVQACRALEAEGVHCNMTLVFSLAQAMACSDAGATLISPFAGRITDYWSQKLGGRVFAAHEDPGVASVRAIYAALKKRGSKTQVMGASFRTKEQVAALAGCDLLTVSPKLLAELKAAPERLVGMRMLGEHLVPAAPAWEVLTEARFREALAADEMASAKLEEGVRRFCNDIDELEKRLAALISA